MASKSGAKPPKEPTIAELRTQLTQVTQERDQARETAAQLDQELVLADQLNGGLQRTNARLQRSLNELVARIQMAQQAPQTPELTVVEGEVEPEATG